MNDDNFVLHLDKIRTQKGNKLINPIPTYDAKFRAHQSPNPKVMLYTYYIPFYGDPGEVRRGIGHIPRAHVQFINRRISVKYNWYDLRSDDDIIEQFEKTKQVLKRAFKKMNDDDRRSLKETARFLNEFKRSKLP